MRTCQIACSWHRMRVLCEVRKQEEIRRITQELVTNDYHDRKTPSTRSKSTGTKIGRQSNAAGKETNSVNGGHAIHQRDPITFTAAVADRTDCKGGWENVTLATVTAARSESRHVSRQLSGCGWTRPFRWNRSHRSHTGQGTLENLQIKKHESVARTTMFSTLQCSSPPSLLGFADFSTLCITSIFFFQKFLVLILFITYGVSVTSLRGVTID